MKSKKVENVIHQLEKVKKQFYLTRESGLSELTSVVYEAHIDKLITYLSYDYRDSSLSENLAEAVLITIKKFNLTNDHAILFKILNNMFSTLETRLQYRYQGVDAHDLEIIFNHNPKSSLTSDCFHDITMLDSTMKDLSKVTSIYANINNCSTFEEKLNLTRMAFLLNQFLYDDEICTLLSEFEDYNNIKNKFLGKNEK